MKPVLALIAMAGGLTLAGAFATPAAAIPFGPQTRMTDEPLAMQIRWVCDPRGNCNWRGADRRALYYGPANWHHCDYRWRVGNHGPYRQRLCW